MFLVLTGPSCKKNHPPQKPTIAGPTSGRPGDTLTFTVETIDPDDDIVSYLFSWGDTASVEWTSGYPSGQNVTRSKVYMDSGDYVLKVKARDVHELESDWSEPFQVHVTEVMSPPSFVGGSDTAWVGQASTYRLAIALAPGYVRYVVDWADGTVDTTAGAFAPAETTAVVHVWNAGGAFDIKARAFLAAQPGKGSDWSPPRSVAVIVNRPPAVDSVQTPPSAVKNVEAFFTIWGSDPDGDSLRVLVNWGSSTTDTGYFPSPCNIEVGHVFTQKETAMVIVETEDWKGMKSAPDTVHLPVVTTGDVVWYWQSSDTHKLQPLTTSALVANDGVDEVVLGSCDGDYRFHSIRATTGRSKASVTTKESKAKFTGHPGLTNGHIIVGSDEGEIYALSLLNGLHKDWQFPDSAAEHGTYVEWGAPAFNGNNFYIGHYDDSIFKFADNGAAGGRVAAYGINAVMVDAPIVDATGNVIFATDSAYLYKMDANLNSVIWRTALLSFGEVYGPVLGSDGTIYCDTDSSRLYAIDPTNGSVKSGWPVNFEGDVSRPALGQSALFVASSFGTAYSINPTTGSINWRTTLSTIDGFYTTPVVAANGYVYFQSEADMLYCVNQADGTIIWTCNCPSYLPRFGGGGLHRPRKLQLTGYDPNPSITSTGDIIVVGHDACYCVVGYPEGPLDPAAAWPKWQKNLYNSGK